MADSPKCLDCQKLGKIGQMYKIAGKARFKCHDCGWIGEASRFQPVEFMWKTKPEAYQDFLAHQVSE